MAAMTCKKFKKQMLKAKGDGQFDNLLNATKKVEPKKEVKNPHGQAQALTEEQLITFLGACAECIAPMFRVIFCVMFATGGRIHEACVTLRENIDLKRGRILVPPEAQKGLELRL